jgi:hypothetical protein
MTPSSSRRRFQPFGRRSDEPELGAGSRRTRSPESAGQPPQPVRFQTVQTRRGFEYIFEQIRASISANDLCPGDRLPPEREMATTEAYLVGQEAANAIPLS